MIESPVIFTTYPLKTGSFSRRKYALFMALITTAIIPPSDFTIPVRAIWSTARQRLPVLHPDPPILWFTTGLTNGSRRPPAMLILWSSFLGSTGFFLSSTATAGFGPLGWSTATLVVFFAAVFGATALATGLGAVTGETVQLAASKTALTMRFAPVPCSTVCQQRVLRLRIAGLRSAPARSRARR